MSIERDLERIANALEKLVELKQGGEKVLGSDSQVNIIQVPAAPEQLPPAPKKAATKKAPAVKAEEQPEKPAVNPLTDFDPATDFKTPAAPATIPAPAAPAAPAALAARAVTHKDVVEKLIAFAKDYGEDQAYAILASFNTKKVKELPIENLQAVIDKIEKFRGLNL